LKGTKFNMRGLFVKGPTIDVGAMEHINIAADFWN